MYPRIIAKRLLALRGDRTREEVANAVGVSISTLCMYELGKRMPREKTMERLAQYYHTTVEELFYA